MTTLKTRTFPTEKKQKQEEALRALKAVRWKADLLTLWVNWKKKHIKVLLFQDKEAGLKKTALNNGIRLQETFFL